MEADFLGGGYYREYIDDVPQEPIKNTLLRAGASYFGRTLFRGEAVLPATYYLGLTNVAYTWTSSLADLAAGEPVGNGYARQPLVKNTVDWTVQEINGVIQVLSKIVNFTASANWDKQWNRMFLCDQAAGTAGFAFSVSGPAPALRTVTTGNGPAIDYQYFFRG